MKKRSFGFWFLFAVILFVSVLMLKAWAGYLTTGSPDDTPAGQVITAEAAECTLNYQDSYGTNKPQVTAPSDLYVTVAAEYGFSGIGPDAYTDTPGTPVVYDFYITNEGNAPDTYYISIESFAYSTGASNWDFTLSTDEVVLAEDGEGSFTLTVTPTSDAIDCQTLEVVVMASTNNTPVGQYTGGNALTYGGTSEAHRTLTTHVTGAPLLKLTRTMTVDAPTEHIAHGGGNYDAVPGAVISFTYTYSNEGTGTAESVILIEKRPPSTEGSHVNATANEVWNITLGVARSNVDGWTVSTTEVASLTTADRTYGATAVWTVIGTPDTVANGGNNYATTEGGVGTFIHGISKGTTYIKFEKPSIDQSEDGGRLTWGVTIR